MNRILYNIRKGSLDDLPYLQALFVNTVHSVCKHDYTPGQIKAWTSGIENTERWQRIVQDQYLLVAEIENQLVGFCSLQEGAHVDMLFVHKDFQGQGIASALYRAIEEKAMALGAGFITTYASKTARSFFERTGFTVLEEQTVVRKGVSLNNFKMKKKV